ncbi:hypothetical protein GCM10011492_02570 [Flexivirga endophytica]|uniref:Uncharacterized protein n=2 Tax=Flexivirga endophytica TaxID=1849103 RepID=A0A916STX3_9MICO|nr:hypothetical protein GCM10011492_02570 [Flexivirga endophytica]
MYRHDMSGVVGSLPCADGSFRSEWLEYALTRSDWHAWMLTIGEHPGGLALVRAVNEPVRVLNSFFVVSGARRFGLGFDLARVVVGEYPGRWDVAYQDANAAAVALWPAVAGSFDAGYTVERRAVPGDSDVPHDVWVSFRTA